MLDGVLCVTCLYRSANLYRKRRWNGVLDDYMQEKTLRMYARQRTAAQHAPQGCSTTLSRRASSQMMLCDGEPPNRKFGRKIDYYERKRQQFSERSPP